MAVMDGSQLVRSRSDRRIAGVCGGLARYFGIDPVLVRIAFVITAFMGFGILAYIVLWIALPEGEPGEPAVASWVGRSSPAVRIAEERFARGEISAEDLNRIREDLTGSP
jgi:phage shock protein PspC (stress-responsive transcriptional regulator)